VRSMLYSLTPGILSEPVERASCLTEQRPFWGWRERKNFLSFEGNVDVVYS
jgi:hypothetical protein